MCIADNNMQCPQQHASVFMHDIPEKNIIKHYCALLSLFVYTT